MQGYTSNPPQTMRGLAYPSAARRALQEMQENRCFYCGGAMKQDPHVDHFIPWSRYPRDLAQNFVLAHGACNLEKGDMLTAPAGFLDDQPAALQVARWADRRCLEILGA